MNMKRVFATHEAAHVVVYRSYEIQVVRVAQEACELECWVSALDRVWSRRAQIIAVAKRLLKVTRLSGDDVDLIMADHELRSDTMADEIRRAAVRIKRPYRRVRC